MWLQAKNTLFACDFQLGVLTVTTEAIFLKFRLQS